MWQFSHACDTADVSCLCLSPIDIIIITGETGAKVAIMLLTVQCLSTKRTERKPIMVFVFIITPLLCSVKTKIYLLVGFFIANVVTKQLNV